MLWRQWLRRFACTTEGNIPLEGCGASSFHQLPHLKGHPPVGTGALDKVLYSPAWCLGPTFPLRIVPRLTLRDICLALSMAFFHCLLTLACVRLSLQTDMQKQHHARHSMNSTSPTPSDRPTRVSWVSVSVRVLRK